MIGKLTQKLFRTREGIVGKLANLIRLRHDIDDDLYDEIEEILISGDIGVTASMQLIQEVRQQIRERGLRDSSSIMNALKEAMIHAFEKQGTRVASSVDDSYFQPRQKPFVIMVVGVNGTGKTTTIGKLAAQFRGHHQKVLIAAADTFRAAASDQLEIWAQRAQAEIIRNQPGADPAAVAFDSLQAAISRHLDVLIIDTAGRLHTKSNLMEELKKIRRVLGKLMPDAPQETLLVLDATTGQNGLNQAKEFTAAVGVTGIVLTKLDGTAKGGIVLAISKELGLPVKFIGVGETIDDLRPFNHVEFVEALFQ
ncbi:MAG: signal recognition particle-docking protein FtsY [candidate division KSB1 bacterium]|nr:signal recognition particle-docking protein FtsY [candidate division KSB1 bacterium]